MGKWAIFEYLEFTLPLATILYVLLFALTSLLCNSNKSSLGIQILYAISHIPEKKLDYLVMFNSYKGEFMGYTVLWANRLV